MNHSKSEGILLVDDQQALLDGMRRTQRRSYRLQTACGGKEALELLESGGPFAVVVSDYQMPEMDGATFLSKVRETYPDIVRIMLTGNADLQTAIDAVNQGNIFRFLSKPCSAEDFAACLESALEQYRLRQAEQTLLEQTVRGSIEVLSEVLALVSPGAFGRSMRVQGYVRQIAKRLKLTPSWPYETAALLSQIGFVSVPTEVVKKLHAGEELGPEVQRVVDRHAEVAHTLLAKIPRLESVAEMVRHQGIRHEAAKTSKLDPATLSGSLILGTALDFDALVSKGASPAEAIATMAERTGAYDQRLLQMFGKLSAPGSSTTSRLMPISELRVGMILEQDVCTLAGAMVVAKGNEITRSMLARLHNYAELHGILEPIRACRKQDLEEESGESRESGERAA